MLFNQHSLRSAPIEMHSLFSALRSSTKLQLQCWPRLYGLRHVGLRTAMLGLAASRVSRCLPATGHAVGSPLSSRRRALLAKSAPRRSHSVGAAESCKQILSVRLRALPEVAKSRLFLSSNTGPCQSVLPNPSINRTASGSRLSQTLDLTQCANANPNSLSAFA